MMISRKRPAVSALLFLMVGGVASVRNAPAQENVDLAKILSQCAAYCEKLRSSALDFVCEERIVENVFPTRYRMSSTGGSRTITYSTPAIAGKPGRNTWRYDYQLVKKGPSIEEKRTLLEFNGKKSDASLAQVKPRRFYSENPVFGPVGFFDRDWHNLYDYQFLKRERVFDREAIVIKVVPKTPIEKKPNFGTIWIDLEDDSVLKIEVEDSSLAGYEQVQAAAKSRGLEPDFVTIHEYAVIKNGLRFPSRTIFEERYKGRVDGFLGGTKSKTEILYSEHRFFTVETDAIIK